MKFFDGLYSYEMVMLVGGSLLFLVSLILLAVWGSKGKSIGTLVIFFSLAIAMIGFPAYSSFEISSGGVKLAKDTHELQQNPTDPVLRQKVSEETAKLSARPIQDPATVTTIARAQIALGDNASAENNVNKVLQAAPQNPAALELKNRIELDQNLERLTSQVEQHPDDQASKTRLNRVVSEASKMQIASPTTIANMARAHVALGNHAQAKDDLDKVLKINPKFTPALQLKNEINSTVIERPR